MIAAAPAGVMFTPRIHAALERDVARLAGHAGIAAVVRGAGGDGTNRARAALFTVAAEDFAGNDAIATGVFGPSSVLIRCPDERALVAAASRLEGQLTATLHFADADRDAVEALLPVLEAKAGRPLANGWRPA